MSVDNLDYWFRRADPVDRAEGQEAYFKYRTVLQSFAKFYDFEFERTVAAFVALSPNNDYYGNLRSLASLLAGVNSGLGVDKITVSTYRACLKRAYNFLMGLDAFLEKTKGLKTRAFYHNILNPGDNRFVTVDGHMYAAWVNEPLTMKEAKVTVRTYRAISADIQQLAFDKQLLPCQMQATIWFARKRVLQIKYDPQLDLLMAADDIWRTTHKPENVQPYT